MVVLAPLLDEDFGLGARAKPLPAQALVAELAVEAFVGSILPRLARIAERGIDAGLVQPLEQCAADELGAVVRAQRARCAVHADQAAEHLDHPARTDAALDVDRQALARPLVDDRQAFERLVVGTGVEPEVVGPPLVRTPRRQGPRALAGDALARPLAWHLQSRQLPSPVRAVPAHPVSGTLQLHADA